MFIEEFIQIIKNNSKDKYQKVYEMISNYIRFQQICSSLNNE